jgi:hypothetical protein
MITASDTNIPLDILVPNEDSYEGSANALEDAAGKALSWSVASGKWEQYDHFKRPQVCKLIYLAPQVQRPDERAFGAHEWAETEAGEPMKRVRFCVSNEVPEQRGI